MSSKKMLKCTMLLMYCAGGFGTADAVRDAWNALGRGAGSAWNATKNGASRVARAAVEHPKTACAIGAATGLAAGGVIWYYNTRTVPDAPEPPLVNNDVVHADPAAPPEPDAAVPVEDEAPPVLDAAEPVENAVPPEPDAAAPVEDDAPPEPDAADALKPQQQVDATAQAQVLPVLDAAVPVEDEALPELGDALEAPDAELSEALPELGDAPPAQKPDHDAPEPQKQVDAAAQALAAPPEPDAELLQADAPVPEPVAPPEPDAAPQQLQADAPVPEPAAPPEPDAAPQQLQADAPVPEPVAPSEPDAAPQQLQADAPVPEPAAPPVLDAEAPVAQPAQQPRVNMFDRSAVHLTGDVERVIYTQSEDGTFRLPQDVRRESIAMVVVRYETKIDPHSVEGCPELQRVIVCPPVETIGDHAFANCQKLSNVQLYETTTEIGERAFLQCNSLKDITLPASIRIIGEGAFYNTGISNVTIKRVSSFLGKSDKDICEQLSLFLGDDRVDAGGTCTVTFEANNKKEKQFRLDYKTGKWQVSGRLKWWAVS